METPCALQMHGQDTEQAYREEDAPPTSINPVSPESFSQVAFTNIQRYYPPRTDIKCTFHKVKEFKSGSKDWVGIFKVGWQTTKEYYTWISVSGSAEKEVLFKAYYLPKDDEDYQFCYVDQNGEVRGVSIPFQFKVDESEIVIVTTQEEMENLNGENTMLKKTNQDLTEMIQTLQAQLQTATEKNNTLEKKNMDQAEMIQTLKSQLNNATKTNNTLEKEYLDLKVQVKTLVEEKETMKRDNIELKLQAINLHDYETELLQKAKDLEKSEAENKKLQMENEAKKQAVMNLSGVLESCKKEVTQQKQRLEVQMSMLEEEKRLKEELQHSLENEKMKALDLESNFEKTTTMLQNSQDNITKLQQQLALQQKENATKDEEIKKLGLTIIHLEAKLNDNCKEYMRRMETADKKMHDNLEELMNREKRKLLDSEEKIRELQIDLTSVHENLLIMEQKLANEQDESKIMKDRISVLTSTVELREEEIRDLNDLYRKKRDEVDELTNQLIQTQLATTHQTPTLAFGNPYEDIPSSITAENESSNRLEARLGETYAPTSRTCPVCSEVFQDVTVQVFEDHVMCHDLEEYQGNSGQVSGWSGMENEW